MSFLIFHYKNRVTKKSGFNPICVLDCHVLTDVRPRNDTMIYTFYSPASYVFQFYDRH